MAEMSRRRSRSGLTISRQAFVRGTLALAASPLALGYSALTSSSTARAADAPLDVAAVAPGIYVHQGRHGLFSPENAGDISNCGFIVGRDAVAVIDTGGSAMIGMGLKAAIRQITDRPIRHVVNTHMHPDHVFGNAAFDDGNTAFVAHHKMARGLGARAERYQAINAKLLGANAFSGTRIVMPQVPVTGSQTIELGERTIVLEAHKTAHTDNDLTVRDVTTGTVFMGDLLFSGHIPTIDGSIRGWLALVARLREEKADRVVPGHGPPAMPWPDAIAPLTRYLTAVSAGVAAAIKSGKTLSEAAETVGLDEKDAWMLFEEYHRRNVSAAFAELEWE